MQMMFDLEPPKTTEASVRESIINVIRQIGPCRQLSIVLHKDYQGTGWLRNELPAMISDGLIKIVGQFRYKGVVPAEHVEDIYDIAGRPA